MGVIGVRGRGGELAREFAKRDDVEVVALCDIDDASFSVSLIPETLERTTLGTAAPGRPVNLEVDVLAKYVEKLITR